ncbi:hypothetical protein ACQVPL_05585 [Bacillus hominis]
MYQHAKATDLMIIQNKVLASLLVKKEYMYCLQEIHL